ncbi:DEAD/DEAH box helicase, partial [Thermogutta sp.]|uniref:DEAD/DEAH box helicase n=1 Tax=Thermogutta sp. TaxID=1962930 RepID=UPI00321FBB79
AGTAAGKTLAIAVPLFEKLKTGRIRKVLLMYPTIALMEDQRQVMDRLAQITSLEIGQLQGGMSRTELIAALNKPVILATPDEIYWFFRKNVKYSGLLIYGLALVDEFVLDEAHLFNGLMLRNLAHLKKRVQLLAAKLGRRPRWHVLTATPTPELRRLTDGVEVRGRSKCGDVEVTFLEPAKGHDHDERQTRLVGAVESALADGAQKVLLVFNSADLAHRVFEGIKGKSRPDLPPDLLWHFGRIRWGQLKAWMEKEEVETETIEEIEHWLTREGPFYLKDLERGQVEVPTEALAAGIAHLLEGKAWRIKRLVYSAVREGGHDLVEAVDRQLGGKGKLTWLLWRAVVSAAKERMDQEGLLEALEVQVGRMQAELERLWADDSLSVTAPGFGEITASLQQAGADRGLAEAITGYLKHTVELPEQAAAALKMSPRELAQRRLAFQWLDWLIRDQARRNALVERIQSALAEGRLEVETRHIASWGDTGAPVVIYTGKMSKAERKGLIEAFAALPRAVLISTPAVEVGVDFAADTLITEQCDGNGFLQRFGRVGRRPGIQGKVVVLVRDGETYVQLFRCYRPQMNREEFSAFIADPGDGVFPARLYAEGSAFLDATHWLVNAQLGEIGGWLNATMFGEETAALARQLREANLPFIYGLRSTLPEVSLQGGGGGEPFYILRKVSNERLLPADSPFEMARADMGYMEFLWKPASWKTIVVDVLATLEASQALFWWQDGEWHVRAGYGIAADYLRLFSNQPVSQGKSLSQLLHSLKPKITQNLEGFLSELEAQRTKPLPGLLLRLGKALPLFFEPYACFILGQGDVHLLRVDTTEGIAEPVEDCLGNPLVLSDQTWLLLYGYGKEEAQNLLERVSALDWQEVFYDWQTLEVQGKRVIGPVLLDRMSGACFDVYRRLVEHDRRLVEHVGR